MRGNQQIAKVSVDVDDAIAAAVMVQAVIARVKEFQIIEVPVFIRLQELDVVAGREAGACILRLVQAEGTAAFANAAGSCPREEDPLSRRDPRAVCRGMKPRAFAGSQVTAVVEAAQGPWSERRVAGGRRNATPWQLAEKQHWLVGKI